VLSVQAVDDLTFFKIKDRRINLDFIFLHVFVRVVTEDADISQLAGLGAVDVFR
jgi:hypothetical protein